MKKEEEDGRGGLGSQSEVRFACVYWTRDNGHVTRPLPTSCCWLLHHVCQVGAGALTAAAVAREAITAGTRAASGASFVAPRLLTAATAAD